MKTLAHELTVKITGNYWGGGFGWREYTLKPSECDDFKTLKDFARIAGDFETVTSAELVACKVTREYEVKIFNRVGA